ncbi:hypothetical protein SKAU_G00308890 [Synaphobranchus kaupii]|uniref:Uncharacterized protein n=1 Tax=Synaphobranchus kaupii TaxID=118154 RepID=A0A9Q1ERA4_SYNKA|nr:hypothetical protein SKAU_G00308890 [Synaphobranchus kaupii]
MKALGMPSMERIQTFLSEEFKSSNALRPSRRKPPKPSGQSPGGISVRLTPSSPRPRPSAAGISQDAPLPLHRRFFGGNYATADSVIVQRWRSSLLSAPRLNDFTSFSKSHTGHRLLQQAENSLHNYGNYHSPHNTLIEYSGAAQNISRFKTP